MGLRDATGLVLKYPFVATRTGSADAIKPCVFFKAFLLFPMLLTIATAAARTKERRKLRIDGKEGARVPGGYGGKHPLLIPSVDSRPRLHGPQIRISPGRTFAEWTKGGVLRYGEFVALYDGSGI